MIRTYSELIKMKTYEERLEYLKLDGKVGEDTFGFDRIFNQRFYKSKEWREIRNQIIARDFLCDIGIPGREIHGKILVHHMNPICIDDITNATEILINPEYLITVSQESHNYIHYGIEPIVDEYIPRTLNDTCPWKN